MALQEKSRTRIYEAMAEMAGEEAAADMLAQFPAREYDDPVTRDHLDMRIAEFDIRFAEVDVRFAEVRTEMADLRTEVKGEIHESQRTLLMWMVATMVSLIAVNSGITFAMLQFV